MLHISYLDDKKLDSLLLSEFACMILVDGTWSVLI